MKQKTTILALLSKFGRSLFELIGMLILTVVFFLIFTPVGAILRLFKKDILNRTFKNDRSSYWADYSILKQNNYTRQY